MFQSPAFNSWGSDEVVVIVRLHEKKPAHVEVLYLYCLELRPGNKKDMVHWASLLMFLGRPRPL